MSSFLENKENYIIFENKCLYDNENDLENFIKNNNIDINFDDGYFLEIICLRNKLDLLKMVIKNNANININNDCILRTVAHEGCDNVLHYLLYNCHVNCNVLNGTTAMTNKAITKNILDDFWA
jgi:hypothetical protein